MLKENESNAYFDLLEQHNIYLEGEKMNRNAAVYADAMIQTLDPIFGNTKEGLMSDKLGIGFIFYSRTANEYITNLFKRSYIRPSFITKKDSHTFDIAISSYLYLILVKKCSDLTVNDLIQLLRTILTVDITDKDTEELTSWYNDALSGVISYIKDNIKQRSKGANLAYPGEVHYEPELERIGVTFVYKRR